MIKFISKKYSPKSKFQVRSLPTDREAALAQNKSLAEWNLAQKPRIENARAQVGEFCYYFNF